MSEKKNPVAEQSDGGPEQDERELMKRDEPMSPEIYFGICKLLPEQIRRIKKDVPAKHIQKTKKFGGTYDTIKHQYAVQHLNDVFYGIWSWEEKSREVCYEDVFVPKRDEYGDVIYGKDKDGKIVKDKDGNPRPLRVEKNVPVSVLVHGRITVCMAGGITVYKDATGGAELARYGDKHYRAGQVISWANAYKSAGSDALKKAASRYGMFPNVYRYDVDEDHAVDMEKLKSQMSDEEFEKILPLKEKIEAVGSTDELYAMAAEFSEKELKPTQWRYLDATMKNVVEDFRNRE